MASENTRITRRVLKELFEEDNLEATEELIHPDFVNHEAPPGNPQGQEGLKETITWLHGLWGPMHADIEDEICQGDKVVARVTMHGRHLGEFLGRPPTGREFATEQIHIYRLQDGKVIEQVGARRSRPGAAAGAVPGTGGERQLTGGAPADAGGQARSSPAQYGRLPS